MKVTKIKVFSVVGLLLTTIIWGSGFVVMKNTLEHVTPMYIIAVRFTVAGIIGLIVFHKNVRKLKKKDLLSGALCGFWLGLAYVLQTYGLKYTSASNNAFLTTFYVILVPFVFWIFRRGKVTLRDFLAAVVAIVGIALLSLTDGFGDIRLGDILTLLCSVAYAGHMFVVDRSTEHTDPILLSVLQMLGTAVFSWICALVLEGAPPQSLISSRSVVLGIIYLAVFATMFAFLMQTMAQKYLSSLTVSILISLECVFGAVFSIFFLGDPFTLQIAAGFVLMAAAIAISTVRKPEKTEGS